MLQIIMFEEKHSTEVYVFSTDDERRAAYLDRLRTRMHPGYEWYGESDVYLTEDERTAVSFTDDGVASLPEPFRTKVVADLVKARKKTERRDAENARVRLLKHVLSLPIEEALLVEDGDGNFLDNFMWDREDYEYEGFDIQTARVAPTSSAVPVDA